MTLTPLSRSKVKGQLAGAQEYCGGLAYIVDIHEVVNIHGAHSYWKQGGLGTAGVRDGLQLGRSVQRAGAYCVATCTVVRFIVIFLFLIFFTVAPMFFFL